MLASRRLISRPRGPFAFPGTLPGFDPSHVAGRAPLFSGVSLGSNFRSLGAGAVGARQGTIAGSPAAKMLTIGPIHPVCCQRRDIVYFSGHQLHDLHDCRHR
jgi:hypothetical protein